MAMQSRMTGDSVRFNRLVISIVILFVILAAGTAGYKVINPHLSVFNAFYMTVITISTVGFEEVEGISDSSRPITIILIFSGIGLISYILYSLSQAVIEGELRRLMGRRKLSHKLSRLKDHVIVCGYGRVGEVVVEILTASRQSFVVIEQEESLRDVFEQKGFLYIIGDATSDEILKEANVQNAAKLVACTSSDAQNVFIVLTARELNARLEIHCRAYSPDVDKRMRSAGANKVIHPNRIGGIRLAMGLLRPTFTDFFEIISQSFEDEGITIDELHVGPGCHLIDRTLMDAGIRQSYNLIILAIRPKDGPMQFNPGKDTVIGEGDTLIAIGVRRDIIDFAKKIRLQEIIDE